MMAPPDRTSQADIDAAREAGVAEERWDQLAQRHARCDTANLPQRIAVLERLADVRSRSVSIWGPTALMALLAAINLTLLIWRR